jgi:hypothetical protein
MSDDVCELSEMTQFTTSTVDLRQVFHTIACKLMPLASHSKVTEQVRMTLVRMQTHRINALYEACQSSVSYHVTIHQFCCEVIAFIFAIKN